MGEKKTENGSSETGLGIGFILDTIVTTCWHFFDRPVIWPSLCKDPRRSHTLSPCYICAGAVLVWSRSVSEL